MEIEYFILLIERVWEYCLHPAKEAKEAKEAITNLDWIDNLIVPITKASKQLLVLLVVP